MILSPVSQPFAFTFFNVTFDTPAARTAIPLSLFPGGLRSPMSHAPPPSIVMFDDRMTSGP